MKLLVQPGDGVTPLINAIDEAKCSIEIVIFRFDRSEIESALARAASRGVSVLALIANTNHGGEKALRDLETRLLGKGITVARTAERPVRHHAKLVIIDRRKLCLLAFNFTYADIERSRSFGVVTSNKVLVREAVRLFEADTKRRDYQPRAKTFVVSPLNSRRVLSDFIRRARKELWIYDPKINDGAMCRLLEERAKAGVDVRVLGHMTHHRERVQVLKLPRMRLHTRTIMRDGTHAFVGSQSLRAFELDARREVGVIFHELNALEQLRAVFEDDWAAAKAQKESCARPPSIHKIAKEITRVVTKELPQVILDVEGSIRELVSSPDYMESDTIHMERMVKDAVEDAVKAAVEEAAGSMTHSQVQQPLKHPVRTVG